MTLSGFDVLGEEISDEETEEIVKPGDPRRSLVRYRPDGSELFVSARINLPLLRASGFSSRPPSQALFPRRRGAQAQ